MPTPTFAWRAAGAMNYDLRNSGRHYLEMPRPEAASGNTVYPTEKPAHLNLLTQLRKRAERNMNNGVLHHRRFKMWLLDFRCKRMLKMLGPWQWPRRIGQADLITTLLGRPYVSQKDYQGHCRILLLEISTVLLSYFKKRKVDR